MAAGVVGVVLYGPSDRRTDLCPLHRLTGLDCPGCGTTRAVELLAHGEVLGALRSNVLAVLAGGWVLGWWVHAVWPSWPSSPSSPARPAWLARWATPLRSRPPAVLWALLAVVVAFTVARNLPGPDRWLAPA